MPSSYSVLNLELMATGEDNLTWGNTTNVNWEALENAVIGSSDVTFASANVTLPFTNTNTPQAARSFRLHLVGTMGGSPRQLIVPSINKVYAIANNTDGDCIVTTAAGTGITVPAGAASLLYVDGTNVLDLRSFINALTATNVTTTNLTATNAAITTLTGTITASGAFTMTNTLNVTGVTTLATLNVTGNEIVSGTLAVSGQLTAFGNVVTNDLTYLYTPYNGATNTGVVRAGIRFEGANQALSFWTANANRGNLDLNGNWNLTGQVTASQFNGSGAGLTGSAGSLSVGYATNAGNASTANTANSANSANNANYATNSGTATNLTGGTCWNTNFTSGNTFSNNISVNNAAFINVNGNIGLYDGAGGWAVRLPYNGQVVIGEYGGRGVYIQGGCTVNGDMYAAGNVAAYSDRRLKTDLTRLDKALDKLVQLTGYSFKRTDLGTFQAGLIAQEVQHVLPVAVSEVPSSGMLVINHGAILGLIVEAIKDLRDEVQYLKGYATR